MSKVGRPLKFNNVGELIKVADKYFKDIPEEEWTITGLALALDTTRETLIEYQNKDEYTDTIKKYKLKVQYAYEKDLRRKGRSGDIFALKNFGWTDRRETDITSKGESIVPILGGATKTKDVQSDTSDTQTSEAEEED